MSIEQAAERETTGFREGRVFWAMRPGDPEKYQDLHGEPVRLTSEGALETAEQALVRVRSARKAERQPRARKRLISL